MSIISIEVRLLVYNIERLLSNNYISNLLSISNIVSGISCEQLCTKDLIQICLEDLSLVEYNIKR